MNERRYFAISIKHSEHGWKFGMPLVLWGYLRTGDNEERCYAGYTEYPNKAELYSIDEFKSKYQYPDCFKYDEPVHMEMRLCKRWKDYDTVFIDAEEYLAYCAAANLPLAAIYGYPNLS